MPSVRLPISIPQTRHLRQRSLPVVVACALLWALAAGVVFAPERAESRESGPGLDTMRVGDLPAEGRRTLSAIRAGGPFASRRDGAVFGNRERLLPRRQRGYYAEYTVPTPGARNRGARRIIAGRGGTDDFRTSGEYYYTDDHYSSFRRILQ